MGFLTIDIKDIIKSVESSFKTNCKQKVSPVFEEGMNQEINMDLDQYEDELQEQVDMDISLEESKVVPELPKIKAVDTGKSVVKDKGVATNKIQISMTKSDIRDISKNSKNNNHKNNDIIEHKPAIISNSVSKRIEDDEMEEDTVYKANEEAKKLLQQRQIDFQRVDLVENQEHSKINQNMSNIGQVNNTEKLTLLEWVSKNGGEVTLSDALKNYDMRQVNKAIADYELVKYFNRYKGEECLCT